MKSVWLTCALLVLAQSVNVTREAKSDGTVFYTAITTATDESAGMRKVQFVIRADKDRFDSPETDALIRLEVKQATRGEYFNERAEAKCGEREIFASKRMHAYTELDAETLAVFTQLTMTEAQALAKCESAALSVGGIRVRLTQEQLAPLAAALSTASRSGKAP